MSPPVFSYEEARYLLAEGDVLLYRGTGLISRCIQKTTKGRYSHVAIASQRALPNEWESVQFREFRGGVTVNLRNDVKRSNSIIDVYRPVPYFSQQIFNPETHEIELSRIPFDGRAVTDCMRNMTGLPYGYNRIYFLWRYYTRPWYDWTTLSTNDTAADDIIYPVCSTVAAHCFTKNNFDLLFNRADDFMSPSDLALSPRLNMLFSIASTG